MAGAPSEVLKNLSDVWLEAVPSSDWSEFRQIDEPASTIRRGTELLQQCRKTIRCRFQLILKTFTAASYQRLHTANFDRDRAINQKIGRYTLIGRLKATRLMNDIIETAVAEELSDKFLRIVRAIRVTAHPRSTAPVAFATLATIFWLAASICSSVSVRSWDWRRTETAIDFLPSPRPGPR